MALDCMYGLKVKAGRKVVQKLTKTNASTLAQANQNAAAMERELREMGVFGRKVVTVTAHPLPRTMA